MCTSLLIRGWAAGEEKHKALLTQLFSFSAWKNAVCLWVHSNSSSVWVALPAPSCHSPLLLWLWTLLLAPLLNDSLLPSPASRAQSTGTLLFYSAHQALAVSCTGRTAVASSHPLAKQCLLVFLLMSICKSEDPPASYRSVKCCGPRGPVPLQSSRLPPLYLLWLPWRWVDSSRTL